MSKRPRPTADELEPPRKVSFQQFHGRLTSARKRFPHRQHAALSELSLDIYAKILSHLQFADLGAAREAGLFSDCPDAAALLVRTHHRARAELSKLRPLLRLRGWAVRSRPDQSAIGFATREGRLTFAPSADGLPVGIGHFNALSELTIDSSRAQQLSLPDELERVRTLRRLYLRAHSFEEFPRQVLALRGLTILDVSHCAELRSLPKDIGVHLPRLRSVAIIGCLGVRKLPRSMLEALERNGALSKAPLKLSPGLFERGYLRRKIVARRFPRLAMFCADVIVENEEEVQGGGGGGETEDDGEDGEELVEVDIDDILDDGL